MFIISLPLSKTWGSSLKKVILFGCSSLCVLSVIYIIEASIYYQSFLFTYGTILINIQTSDPEIVMIQKNYIIWSFFFCLLEFSMVLTLPTNHIRWLKNQNREFPVFIIQRTLSSFADKPFLNYFSFLF